MFLFIMKHSKQNLALVNDIEFPEIRLTKENTMIQNEYQYGEKRVVAVDIILVFSLYFLS